MANFVRIVDMQDRVLAEYPVLDYRNLLHYLRASRKKSSNDNHPRYAIENCCSPSQTTSRGFEARPPSRRGQQGEATGHRGPQTTSPPQPSMKEQMKKACIQLSDSVWTLTYTENQDGSITIQNFDREDNDGYMFRNSLGVLQQVNENNDTDRIVESVQIDGVTYRVQNQQNVFTYKQPL
jgi:hypothetical protein